MPTSISPKSLGVNVNDILTLTNESGDASVKLLIECGRPQRLRVQAALAFQRWRDVDTCA
jgi:hypothetical protein